MKMTASAAILALASVLTLAGAHAAGFEPYPGAVPSPELEAAAGQEEVQIGIDPSEGTVSYFTTSDSFDDVLAFFLQHGHEFAMPPMPGLDDNGRDRGLAAAVTFGADGFKAVPTGVRVNQAFVIFDDAEDINESSDWLTIIRPVVFGARSGDGIGWRFTPVRTENATAIVRMRRQ
ncbi:hypothetical protein [Mesorhizobium sp. KR2-14]|uniref:hypothetical protein n=1 Tax=Mesorhizobium sp. KR2-14 TaxID=3156610 RepID=UPI0032B36DE8